MNAQIYNTDTSHYELTDTRNNLIPEFGMIIDGGDGTLKYVKRCFFRRGSGVFLEYRGTHGTVDVLIMEGEYVHERVKNSNDDMEWVILPCPIGSIAIIGKKYESLDRIEQLLGQTIHWLQRH